MVLETDGTISVIRAADEAIGRAMMTKQMLIVALVGAAAGCGRERETGVPPSVVSDSAILADTARRDVVDLEDIRPPGLPDPVIVNDPPASN